MSIVKSLLSASRVKSLEAGIHENVFIKEVKTERQKKNDGTFLDTLFTIVFCKLNEDGSEGDTKEHSFWAMKSTWNPDTLEDLVKNNFIQLTEIFTSYYTDDQVDDAFNPFSAVGIQEASDIRSILSKKNNMTVFNEALKEGFVNCVQNFVGNKDFLFRLKLAYNNKGFIEPSRYAWIESMRISKEDSTMAFTVKEQENEIQAKTPKDPSQLGAKPGLPGAAPTLPNMGGGAAPAPGALPNPMQGGAMPSAPAPTPAPAPAPTPAPQETPAPQSETTAQPTSAAPEASNAGLPGAPFGESSQPQSTPAMGNNPLGGIPKAQ